jgi:hypothetical protein
LEPVLEEALPSRSPAVEARASLFETASSGKSEGDSGQEERKEEKAKPVFLASRGVGVEYMRRQTMAVHYSDSPQADARAVAVPSAPSTAAKADLASLQKMNGELVSTLMRLTVACTEMEKTKDVLSRRIRDLESQAARAKR